MKKWLTRAPEIQKLDERWAVDTKDPHDSPRATIESIAEGVGIGTHALVRWLGASALSGERREQAKRG